MSKLYDLYISESTKELLIIYAKSCILKEYLHVLPIISKLDVTSDVYLSNESNKLLNKYHADVSDYISRDDLFDIFSESIIDIINKSKVYQTQFIDFIDNFPNTFAKYDTEDSNKISKYDQQKYLDNNLYVEKYIRFVNVDASQFVDQFDRALALNYKEVVNVNKVKELLEVFKAIRNSNNLNSFFDIFANINIGCRLIVNPIVTTTDKSRLYNDIIRSDLNAINEKINAIYIKNDTEERYYFPLLISKIEYNVFNLINKDFDSFYNFINSENLNSIFEIVCKTLNTQDSFAKMFQYHIPVNILLPVISENIKEKYGLLHDVFKNNLPYYNLNNVIINLIDKIKNIDKDDRL